MRQKVIGFLKTHPTILNFGWTTARVFLKVVGFFVPVRTKTILFASFGGRKFDDSPKAIYDEICKRPEFTDWQLIWAFVNPDAFEIPRGEKIKIDTMPFFLALMYSQVWVSNSGMDRGIGIDKKKIVKVETWHGTPLKKIGGDEHQNALGGKQRKKHLDKKLDSNTIRCAQSEFDRDIFQRIFHSTKEAFLVCDLPRNDALLQYTDKACQNIKRELGLSNEKKVILYTPTYREYLIDERHNTYIAPPLDLTKWKEKLGSEYVFLIRAHYAVTAALKINDNDFVKDVSDYPILNDLYAIADLMISDYSSTFFDYAILDRPMFCFAYDLPEYMEKRGLYLDLEKTLPCSVDKDEDILIEHILTRNNEIYIEKTKKFHQKFAPFAGNASKAVVDEIMRRVDL